MRIDRTSLRKLFLFNALSTKKKLEIEKIMRKWEYPAIPFFKIHAVSLQIITFEHEKNGITLENHHCDGVGNRLGLAVRTIGFK